MAPSALSNHLDSSSTDTAAAPATNNASSARMATTKLGVRCWEGWNLSWAEKVLRANKTQEDLATPRHLNFLQINSTDQNFTRKVPPSQQALRRRHKGLSFAEELLTNQSGIETHQSSSLQDICPPAPPCYPSARAVAVELESAGMDSAWGSASTIDNLDLPLLNLFLWYVLAKKMKHDMINVSHSFVYCTSQHFKF